MSASMDELSEEFAKGWKAAEERFKKPNLGLATTKELIDELAARASVAETVKEKWPSYTTVGG